MPFETKGIETLDDYTKQKWPDSIPFNLKRCGLLEIPLAINRYSDMFFADYQYLNKIELSFQDVKMNGRHYFQVYDEDNPYSAVIEDIDNAPYGIRHRDTMVKVIKYLNINGETIDSSIFSDILNPIQFESFLSLKPVEAYKSTCGRYLFLYLFGEVKTDTRLDEVIVDYSYMAKYIFRTDGTFVGRMVERGHKLKYFGFGDNPFFSGF